MILLAQIPADRDKVERAELLLQRLAENGLDLIVLSSIGLFFRIFRAKSEHEILARPGVVLRLSGSTDLHSRARKLASFVWHKPRTRFLVVRDLSLAQLRRASAGGSFEEIEAQLRDSIVLCIDPVDDDLEIYGAPTASDLATKLALR